MIGLDCNILIQLAFAEHTANKKTRLIVHAEIESGTDLVFPSLIITEFLHIATDGRRFSPPFTMPEAVAWIQEFMANPAVRLLEPTRASLDQTLQWMEQFNLGRKRILDTHLAAILFTNGIRRLLTSNPSDFTVFGFLETVTP
jgi:predicted nucleic acid-binding protein